MPEVEHSVEVGPGIDDVWRYVANLENWAAYVIGFQEVGAGSLNPVCLLNAATCSLVACGPRTPAPALPGRRSSMKQEARVTRRRAATARRTE